MTEPGPYTIVAKLGEGGMAEVFKAMKTGPDGWEKPIALKRILPYLADNEAFIRMLSMEARLHAQLDHPNLVQVIDFFQYGTTYMMALEYVSGKNLRRIIHDAGQQKLALPWSAGVHIVAEILQGLDFAHKRRGSQGPLNIVHRDVSPQNVLISYDGIVKLSDFGIAWANIERDHTTSGVLKGKYRYLSPEQLESKPVDFHADLFSTAMVLYEVLTGQHPFEAVSDFETMKRISAGTFAPSTQLCPDVPQAIHKAIEQALKTDPGHRFADASEFRSALLAGQDPKWISSGTNLLKEWLNTLYPKPTDRLEPALEKTPLLARPEALISVDPKEGHSLLATPLPQVENKVRTTTIRRGVRWAWGAAAASIVLGGWTIWTLRTPSVPPPLPTPIPIPSEAPTAAPTTVVTAKPSPVPTAKATPRPARAIKPKPGQLQIDGPKGATVYLNGRKIGSLPLQVKELPPGDYLVLISPENLPSSMTRVTLRSSRMETVKWIPKPLPMRKTR